MNTWTTLPDQGTLFPANVLRLRELGAAFEWVRQNKTIVVPCPVCGKGNLFMNEQNPWSWCAGDVHCGYDRMSFPALLELIAVRHPSAGKITKSKSAVDHGGARRTSACL